VAPPEGAVPEIDLVERLQDDSFRIVRIRGSSLTGVGEKVLTESQLCVLGAALAGLEDAWTPPSYVPRDLVPLDVEFKAAKDGTIRIKQVRPYLYPRTELFARELLVPVDAEPVQLLGIPQEPAGIETLLGRKLILLPWKGALDMSVRPGVREHVAWLQGVRMSGEDFGTPRYGSIATDVDVSPWAEGRVNVVWSAFQRMASSGDSVDIEAGFTAGLTLDRIAGTGPVVNPGLDIVTVTRGGEMWTCKLYDSAMGAFPLHRIEVLTADGGAIVFYERRPANSALAFLVRAEVSLGTVNAVVEDPLALASDRGTSPQRKVFLTHLPASASPAHAVLVELLLGEPLPVVHIRDVNGNEIERMAGSEYRERLVASQVTTAFVRGDANGDGVVSLADVCRVLGFLFEDRGSLPCPDAADMNDDGVLNISDAVLVLRWLFGGTGDTARCARDATNDDLPPCDYGPWWCGEM